MILLQQNTESIHGRGSATWDHILPSVLEINVVVLEDNTNMYISLMDNWWIEKLILDINIV